MLSQLLLESINPLMGRLKPQSSGPLYNKFRDFLPISRYISQTIQDSAIFTMEGE